MDPYSSDRTDRTTPDKNSPSEGDAGTHRKSIFTDSPIDISETDGDYLSKGEDTEMMSKKAKTDDSEDTDDKPEERPVQIKRSTSMLRFDKWNVGARYQLTRILGQGSYGEVAEAWDTTYVSTISITYLIFYILYFLCRCSNTSFISSKLDVNIQDFIESSNKKDTQNFR